MFIIGALNVSNKGVRAVKKGIVILLILIFISVCSFLAFYFQKPEVILKKNLVCEINTECRVFDYVKSVKNGLISSKNKIIDSSKVGTVRVILETENLVKKKNYYKFKILVKDTIKPVITYNKEISITEGDSIDLLNGVSVYDNSLEEIKANVVGDYNINAAGVYNLKYVAEDSSHNVTTEDFVLTVTKRPVVIHKSSSNVNFRNFYGISQNVQQNAVLNRAIIDAGGIFPWLTQTNNKQERAERLINMSTFFGFAFLAPVINVPLGNRITMNAMNLTDKFFDHNCNAIQLSNKYLTDKK